MARQCKLGSNLHLCIEDQEPETDEPKRKRRKDDYMVKWERQRDWLFFDDKTDGMYCKLCRRWDTKPRSGKALWNTTPCICIR